MVEAGETVESNVTASGSVPRSPYTQCAAVRKTFGATSVPEQIATLSVGQRDDERADVRVRGAVERAVRDGTRRRDAEREHRRDDAGTEHRESAHWSLPGSGAHRTSRDTVGEPVGRAEREAVLRCATVGTITTPDGAAIAFDDQRRRVGRWCWSTGSPRPGPPGTRCSPASPSAWRVVRVDAARPRRVGPTPAVRHGDHGGRRPRRRRRARARRSARGRPLDGWRGRERVRRARSPGTRDRERRPAARARRLQGPRSTRSARCSKATTPSFRDAIALVFGVLDGPLPAAERARLDALVESRSRTWCSACGAPCSTTRPRSSTRWSRSCSPGIRVPYLAIHGSDPGVPYVEWLLARVRERAGRGVARPRPLPAPAWTRRASSSASTSSTAGSDVARRAVAQAARRRARSGPRATSRTRG